MSKLAQNKEKKRLAILAAGQQAFLSEGYVAASMDRIAAEAGVTKQTVYRYYASKLDLFQAVLKFLGERPEADFSRSLETEDTEAALLGFAQMFIRMHLSEEHLATYRLLVAESARAPELTEPFFAEGPDDTGGLLNRFFSERLGLKDPEPLVHLWTSMLLGLRDAPLLGRGHPSSAEIEIHARQACRLLLDALPAR